jgi:hypothetical protein
MLGKMTAARFAFRRKPAKITTFMESRRRVDYHDERLGSKLTRLKSLDLAKMKGSLSSQLAGPRSKHRRLVEGSESRHLEKAVVKAWFGSPPLDF